MNETELLALLSQVGKKELSIEQALAKLKTGPFQKTELDFATLDHHRILRHGMTEVIYGESKSIEQIVAIADKLSSISRPVLITRLQPEKISALKKAFAFGKENSAARTFLLNPPKIKSSSSNEPFAAIVAAGTSDVAVAEEAAEVCVAMEIAHEKVYDVGISGLHRLLDKIEGLQKAEALVVVAGMEGALPSVVAGLVGKPIFAVPTSVGYGASFGGLSALLAMLNSCAPGVSVFNIDNGFSAGFAACQVVRAVKKALDGKKDANE